MKKIFDSANQYINESDWTMIAILKFCLASLGILIGVNIPGRYKKQTEKYAGMVFVLTWLMLVPKYFRILFEKENDCDL